MKKNLFALLPLLLACLNSSGQEQQVQGNAIAEIFTDFHININDTSKHTGFALSRAYLGYQFLPGGNFSAKIIVNVGSPEDLVNGATPHRYAYFREASIAWSDERLTVTMGITSTKLFEFQQKFLGKRFILIFYSWKLYLFEKKHNMGMKIFFGTTFQFSLLLEAMPFQLL